MSWTPILISHVVSASLGLGLGAVQLLRKPHGGPAHRTLGVVWVLAILWAAVSSFWIRELNDGAFSWLHVLSVVTIVSAINGTVQARRGNITAHRIAMTSTWAGGLIAFIFALAVPQRMIPTYVVAEPGGAAAFVGSIVVVSAALVVTSTGATRTRARHKGNDAVQSPRR